MKKHAWQFVLGGIIILAVAGVAYRILASRSPAEARRQPSPLVQIQTPTRDRVVNALSFTGDVNPIQQAAVYAKVTGTLDGVYVDMGARVQRGQVLALIDTTELYQQYQQAFATQQNARLTYLRAQELFDQNLIARQDLDNAEAAAKIAAAALDAARTKLGYAKITAPFSGYVTKRFFDPGAVLTPTNATLFTLMNLDAMKIVVNVQEKDIPLITVGKKAVLTVDAFAGREFSGTVTRFSQAVDPSTRTMDVEIDITNRDQTLKPGMFAKVTLVVDEHANALTVPTAAILKDNAGTFVYTVVNDTARQLRISAGIEQQGRTEITSGLKGNETIITTGQQFVKNGGPVIIQK